MIVRSHNEWGRLRSVIVGRAANARVPADDISLRAIYSYMHLDSTISLLRPGLALLNPERMNSGNLPAFFEKWRALWCPPPVDIGYYPPCEHASR